LDPLVRDELVEGLLGQASESTIFISSHDLAEIENLATHVGYLEQGHLRVSEQMTTLSERFREVELTLAESWTPREDLPNTWMHVSSSAAVLRFIDTRFNEERTKAEISRLFGNPRHVSFTPMSLRSIFLALAKAGRTSA
jgi:ABC-2 type transport system ATP-binding protein